MNLGSAAPLVRTSKNIWSWIEPRELNVANFWGMVHTQDVLTQNFYVMQQYTDQELEMKKRCMSCGSELTLAVATSTVTNIN